MALYKYDYDYDYDSGGIFLSFGDCVIE